MNIKKEIEEKTIELGYFRSYNFHKDAKPVVLCKHIEIEGKLTGSDEGCEYIENLIITCKTCKTTFVLNECIN